MHTRFSCKWLKKAVLVLLIILLLLPAASCLSDSGKTSQSKDTTPAETTIDISTEETTAKTTMPSATGVTGALSPENAELAEKINDYMKRVEYHGIVFVAQEGTVIFEKAYGFSDHQTKEANRTDTIFELGSITKQFTAAAIMQLKEQGLLTLDDPLSLYIPEYPYAEKITIRQLLNMTSGVPDYVTNGALGIGLDAASEFSIALLQQVEQILTSQFTHDQIIEAISKYELLFEPGTDHSYSNSNYYFLGMIIEQLSGVSYFDYLEQNFFAPLGMDSTSTDPANLTSSGAILL